MSCPSALPAIGVAMLKTFLDTRTTYTGSFCFIAVVPVENQTAHTYMAHSYSIYSACTGYTKARSQITGCGLRMTNSQRTNLAEKPSL